MGIKKNKDLACGKQEGIQLNIEHHFAVFIFYWQAYCDLCGKMITIGSSSGRSCSQCCFKVHEKCVQMVPKNCGVDECLLSRELKNSNCLREFDLLSEEYKYRKKILQLEQKSLDEADDDDCGDCIAVIEKEDGHRKMKSKKTWKDMHDAFGERILEDRIRYVLG